jgi:hypothetical protein
MYGVTDRRTPSSECRGIGDPRKGLAMFRDDSIADSWDALCDRLDATDQLPAWAALEPGLGGVESVRELSRLTAPGTDPQRADAIIGALLRLGSASDGDDGDALLVLLHLLSPGVTRMSVRFADLTPDPVRVVTGELAARARAFGRPGRRGGQRHRAFAKNLLRDTERAVLHEFRPSPQRPGARDVLVDPTDPSLVALLDRPVAGPDADAPGEAALLDLMDRANAAGLASARDLAVLVDAERSRDRHVGAEPQAEIAARLGMTAFSLRRRRARALSALRVAAADDSSGVACTARHEKVPVRVRERSLANAWGNESTRGSSRLEQLMTSSPVHASDPATSSMSPDEVANLLETVSSVTRYLSRELGALSSGCAAVNQASQARQEALLAGLRQATAIRKRVAGLDVQLFLAGAQVWADRCAAGGHGSAIARSTAHGTTQEQW